jgi:pimeloyl-ACP methyl ester carboxylesterase
MSHAKPPVVMIHGAFSGGWAFETWQRVFEDAGYRVFTPTLRHHEGAGTPPRALAETSIRDYADDVEALLEEIGEPAVLAGHSMGGLIAQMLAARGRATALILLAPSAPWGVLPSTPFEMISAQALYLAGDFWRKTLWPERWVASTHALDRLDARSHDDVLARMVPESGLATFEILHWMFDVHRATAVDARAVSCPILCFAGSADRINPPATVRRIAKRYRGRVQYRELDGFSHWPMAEPGWEAVANHALFWLERLAARPADAPSGQGRG